MADKTEKFIPFGKPLSEVELAEYISNDEVAITRGDVERAIATAHVSLDPFLKAIAYKGERSKGKG